MLVIGSSGQWSISIFSGNLFRKIKSETVARPRCCADRKFRGGTALLRLRLLVQFHAVAGVHIFHGKHNHSR